MPEPNPKDPIPDPAYATTYGYQTLDTLHRQGVEFIEFWCVGGQAFGRRCEHRESKRIDDLLRTLSPGTNLVMMARRARCARCKKRGCYVQPAKPPV